MKALLATLLLVSCLLSGDLWASPELPVIKLFNASQYRIDAQVLLLEDPQADFTLEQVASELADQFVPNTDTILNLGFSQSAYWLKFRVSYPDGYPNRAEQRLWYLEAGRTLLDVAELYWQDNAGEWQQMRADVRAPWSDREVRYVTSVYPVSLHIGEERTYYLRLINQSAFYVPLMIWTPEALTQKITYLDFVYGLYYGGMLILILYNLFVYLSVRDITYIYYILYLSGVVFFQFIELGHGTVLFDNAHEIFPKYFIVYAVWFAWACAILYTRKFLDIERRHPFLDAVLKTLFVIVLCNMLVSMQLDTRVALIWASSSSAILLTLIPCLSFYVWYKGNEDAAYFSGAWVFTVLGLSIYASVALGVFPASPALLSAMPIGTLLEAVLLAFALAERIKRIQRSAFVADRAAMTNLTRYRSLFENALEGMYQSTLTGQLVNANPAMASFFGYASPTQLLSSSVRFQECCLGAQHEALGVVQQAGYWQQEICIATQEKGEVWCRHTMQLIRDSDGQPSHIEGTLIDISERKAHLKARLVRTQAQLEQTIARNASIAKSEFLGRMNHGIRTPLTAIIGYSECLQSERLTPGEQRRAAQTLLSSSQNLLQLINNILDYSKLEAGKMELEQLRLDPVGLLQDLVAELTPAALAHKCSLQLNIYAPIPQSVGADSTRLNQLVRSLLLSVIDQALNKTIQVDLKASSDRRALEIRLSWPGSLLTSWVHILHDGAVMPTGPTELNLAIARQLASLMKGDVIYCEQDQLVCLCYSQPLDEAQDLIWLSDLPSEFSKSAPVPQSNVRQAKQTVSKDPLQGHVLLAEDNPVNQALIQRVLRKFGVRVTTVEQGDQALETALAVPDVDLILMDVNMPEMDGLEATRRLRAAGYEKPIYALTAERGQEEVSASFAAGCNGHLLKPLELKKLYDVLAQHLASADQEQTAGNLRRLPPAT